VPHRQVYQGEFIEGMYPDRTVFDAEVELRRRMNSVTRDLALSEGKPLFDLERALAGRSDIFYDMFHLNRLGGRVVAETFIQGGFASMLGTQPVSNVAAESERWSGQTSPYASRIDGS
jgi:hypothetical protein